ncbi:glycoside hydrolase family 16 protein [Plenodomus tracheiphilus IPT5]|uniref:Glycoside hydrolase family 16 protein n=1 Tax=Plenodomus tracheiphilus IPT5 TaxID=1408161 RepID=A0A6A7B868_9PLEO|nr:glycoside hydrolase family 16 protein [Plenodomus tracheiphilus IPT5]
MHISLSTALLLTTVSAFAPSKRATTLIPSTVFDSKENLEDFFNYNYPWGPTHNGAARMDPAHAIISSPGVLTLTAQPAANQPPAGKKKNIPIHYLSGAVHAKQQFTVPRAGGLEFRATLKAPVARGTWPAFWLTAVQGWPPEVDMAEFKGTGKISFNTFNTSSSAQSKDIQYDHPEAWHDVKCDLVDNGGGVVKVTFWLDGNVVTTQYGKDYVGKAMWLMINLQMEGSSGSPGPTTNTTFEVKNLGVTTL